MSLERDAFLLSRERRSRLSRERDRFLSLERERLRSEPRFLDGERFRERLRLGEEEDDDLFDFPEEPCGCAVAAPGAVKPTGAAGVSANAPGALKMLAAAAMAAAFKAASSMGGGTSTRGTGSGAAKVGGDSCPCTGAPGERSEESDVPGAAAVWAALLHDFPGVHTSLPVPSCTKLSRLRSLPCREHSIWVVERLGAAGMEASPDSPIPPSPRAPPLQAPRPVVVVPVPPLHSKPGRHTILPKVSGPRYLALRFLPWMAQLMSPGPGTPEPPVLHSFPGAQMNLPVPSLTKQSKLRSFPWVAQESLLSANMLSPSWPGIWGGGGGGGGYWR